MIESIMTFFALWGIGFWAIIGLASVIFIVGCERDTIGLSIFATIVLAVLYWKTLILVFNNPIILTIFIVGWLIVGVLNSMWRLRNLARDIVEKYNETGYGDPNLELKLKNHRSRITNWIVYWPWSLFWNFTRDFFNSLYQAMSGVYQGIIDKALINVKPKIVKKNEDTSFWSRPS